MTVTREPIRFALESAPTDRFDDDSGRVFRVVAFTGAGAPRTKVTLTRDHPNEQDALQVFADKIKYAASVHQLVYNLPTPAVQAEAACAAAPKRRLYGLTVGRDK